MKFSIKNVRKLQEEIKKEQQEIEETKKLDTNLKKLADNFRQFDLEKKKSLFKNVSIISICYSQKLVQNAAFSGYLQTDILVTKNFIIKKLLTKKLSLLKEKDNFYNSCIASANEFLRRVGWDIDMS